MGCDSIVMLDLDILSPLVIQREITEYDDGSGTGSIKVVIAGGLPPYQYEWSNGAVQDSIGGIEPGTYTLTVTDNNGCQETFELMLTTNTSHPLLDEVVVYPNPVLTGEVLNIRIPGQLSQNLGAIQWIGQDGKIIIATMDLQGQQLQSTTPMSSGVYQLRLIDKNGKALGAIRVAVINP